MHGKMRILVPLALVVLAGLVVFEPLLPGHAYVAREFGETAVLRFALGVISVIVLLMLLELYRVEFLFKQVIEQFKSFHESQGGPAPTKKTREEAVRILISALDSEDPKVRQSSLDNLRRLTGQDLGAESAPWRSWAGEEFDSS